MSDLPQRLRENVTMEYDRTDDVMLEAADRIEADEALLRQALEALEWIAAQRTGGMIQRKATEPIAALRERLGEKP